MSKIQSKPHAHLKNEDGIEAFKIVISDLFTIKPWIYWFDFLNSAILGWSAYSWMMGVPMLSGFWMAGFAIAVFAFYRAVVFTHELSHLKREQVPGLRFVWNFLCGFPFLLPHFLYRGVHIFHHSKNHFATQSDGEYFPFVTQPTRYILIHLLWNWVLPAIAFLRFAVIGPVSFVHPTLRKLVMRKMSSMTLRITFDRPIPARLEELRGWIWQEIPCICLTWISLSGVALSWWTWKPLVQWYCILAAIGTFNMARAIGGTHRYRIKHKHSLPADQMADTVNVDSNHLLTLLICPTGLRFHAVHHMFPTLPYHALGKAHRRLMDATQPGSPYHRTVISGVLSGLFKVWSEARAHAEKKSKGWEGALCEHTHSPDI